MASRSLDDLHPLLKPLALTFVEECAEAGLSVLVYCTWRSNEEQAELYKIGRTKPGKIVTRAKPGQSAHNFKINGKPAARAFDFVPLIAGKPVWSERHPAWKQAGQIAMSLGLNWYGAPGSPFRELAHVELPKEST